MNLLDAIYPELCNIAQQIKEETGKQLTLRISISPPAYLGVERSAKQDIYSITILPKNAFDREMKEHNNTYISVITKKYYDLYIYLDSSKICLYSRQHPFKSKQDLEWTDPQMLDTLGRIMTNIAD